MIELDSVAYGYGRKVLISPGPPALPPGSFPVRATLSGAGKTPRLSVGLIVLGGNRGPRQLSVVIPLLAALAAVLAPRQVTLRPFKGPS